MACFVVMEPAGPGGSLSEAARLVRDGFSLPGFVVPLFWLAWHGLWIETLAGIAVYLGIAVLGEVAGLAGPAAILSLLVSFAVGLEGAALRLAALRRRGWHERSVVIADSAAEAEIRYAAMLADEEGETPVSALPSGPLPAAPRPPRADGGPALGLLSYPVRG